VTELPTEEQFRGCLGETFTVRLESEGPVSLTLAEVASLTERGADAPWPIRRNPFSLRFRGEPGLTLPQRIYRLEHDRLGAHDIFLVPIQPDAEGTQFEAVFG
jgi:hypothetical protein